MTSNSKPVNPNWERVKLKLSPFQNTKNPSREMKQWSMNVFGATVVGAFLGAKIGGRFLRDRFIYYSRGQVYHHAVEAHRKMHSYTVRGAVNLGSKWGWKLGIFCAFYSGIQISLAVYRDRNDVLNYMCAGAITGPLFYLNRGIRPMIGASFVLGILVSFPIGLCAWVIETFLDYYESKGEKEKTDEIQDKSEDTLQSED